MFLPSVPQQDDDGEHDYYRLAHSVREKIAEQASILVNGKLKTYQVSNSYILLI